MLGSSRSLASCCVQLRRAVSTSERLHDSSRPIQRRHSLCGTMRLPCNVLGCCDALPAGRGLGVPRDGAQVQPGSSRGAANRCTRPPGQLSIRAGARHPVPAPATFLAVEHGPRTRGNLLWCGGKIGVRGTRRREGVSGVEFQSTARRLCVWGGEMAGVDGGRRARGTQRERVGREVLDRVWTLRGRRRQNGGGRGPVHVAHS